MHSQRISKLEVAEVQLLKAIELFCSGKEMIPAITLAGAAEEILGKLVSSACLENALDKEIRICQSISQEVFGSSEGRKAFADLSNFPRNELKHLSAGQDLDLDFEQEAVSLIARAIENYQKLRPGQNSAFSKFEDQAAVWWLRRTKQYEGGSQ